MERDQNTRALGIAATVLGLGLGGFFDGIVFHQILQWHHMISGAGFPPSTLRNLELNTLWDGLFHAAAYILTVVGVILVVRAQRGGSILGAGQILFGGVLVGWGIFNPVEGLVNHQLLGIHHVRDDLPEANRLVWDTGFLVWGLVMVAVGEWLRRQGIRGRQAAPRPQVS